MAYYYVEYGTVLAFLSRPTQNYCSEAQAVLDEVRLKYSSDPILMSIVEDSEGICRRLASEGSPSQAGTSTPGTPSTPEYDGRSHANALAGIISQQFVRNLLIPSPAS